MKTQYNINDKIQLSDHKELIITGINREQNLYTVDFLNGKRDLRFDVTYEMLSCPALLECAIHFEFKATSEEIKQAQYTKGERRIVKGRNDDLFVFADADDGAMLFELRDMPTYGKKIILEFHDSNTDDIRLTYVFIGDVLLPVAMLCETEEKDVLCLVDVVPDDEGNHPRYNLEQWKEMVSQYA